MSAVAPTAIVLVLANLAVGAAIWLTPDAGLGRADWHDEAAFALIALGALAALPVLRHRRVTTLILASSGAWCMATGFLLVYVTPDPGGGRGLGWWHAVTGAAMLVAFIAHWARNNARLVGLVARLNRCPAAMAALLGGWTVACGAALFTWISPDREELSRLSDSRLDDLTTFTSVLVGIAVLVVGVALARRMEATASRNRARGAVDASLWLSMWIATLTGFAILYLTRPLRAADGYWLVVAWHIVASVILLGLVGWHAAFNRRPLAAHASR